MILVHYFLLSNVVFWLSVFQVTSPILCQLLLESSTPSMLAFYTHVPLLEYFKIPLFCESVNQSIWKCIDFNSRKYLYFFDNFPILFCFIISFENLHFSEIRLYPISFLTLLFNFPSFILFSTLPFKFPGNFLSHVNIFLIKSILSIFLWSFTQSAACVTWMQYLLLSFENRILISF